MRLYRLSFQHGGWLRNPALRLIAAGALAGTGEGRVGEKGRSRWGPDSLKKKKERSWRRLAGRTRSTARRNTPPRPNWSWQLSARASRSRRHLGTNAAVGRLQDSENTRFVDS